MPDLYLYNTLTRSKDLFTPLHAPAVTYYSCGPTVYHYAHLGNLRAYVFADVLERVLQHNGYNVDRVMNITDVGHLVSDSDDGEDKMEKGARREGKSVWDIAKHYTDVFLDDLQKLNCTIPSKMPRATNYVPQMIVLIQELEQKGYTYQINDGIYFDTGKFPSYADLGRLDLKGLQEGARVEANPEKKNPSDFALWKFSPEGEKRQMEWEPPWGIGFPGWHIECSAMAMELLGETIDIHSGGIDHIPVHHTNEIAQSEAATGKPFSRWWMHGGWVVVGEDEKMAKSGDNFFTLQGLTEKGFHPLAYRYLCLTAHYRSKMDFSWEAVAGAQNALDHMSELLQKTPGALDAKPDEELLSSFVQKINDDLGMPGALDILWGIMKTPTPTATTRATLLACDMVLGLEFAAIPSMEEQHQTIDGRKRVLRGPHLEEHILALIVDREKARLAKSWETADRLRAKIQEEGIVVEDTKEGVQWFKTFSSLHPVSQNQ